MLILPKTCFDQMKNRLWEEVTPNEHFLNNDQYRLAVRTFAAENGFKCGRSRPFIEIRIVNQRSVISLSERRWWDDPLFMDHVFWVFQKPVTFWVSDSQFAQFYALEPFESRRIARVATDRFGKNPFSSTVPPLLVPVDCCFRGFDETKGGYSEHIRWGALDRLKAQETPEKKEKEEAQKARVEKILKNVEELGEKFEVHPENETKASGKQAW